MSEHPARDAIRELEHDLKFHDYHWSKGDQIKKGFVLILIILKEIIKRLP